jgi:hypothetical protein
VTTPLLLMLATGDFIAPQKDQVKDMMVAT